MKRTLFGISLVALSTALCAAHYPKQNIQLGFGPNDAGTLAVTASTFGNEVIDLNSSKLRLFARPYVADGAVARKRSLAAKIGPAMLQIGSGFSLTHPLRYSVQTYSIAVVLSRPPGPPGMYDVWAQALDGFAMAQGGTSVPIDASTGFTPAHPFHVFWPDESGNDRALEKLRKKLVGRLIYGYGGISFSCRPNWTRFYSASTPVRVRSIEREREVVTWLGTGNAALAPYARGEGFIAFDPLSMVVEEPSAARYRALGKNDGVRGSTKECPAIELADGQIETALSLRAPPPGSDGTPPPLHIGMTRDDVAWTRGYPNEVGTRAALRAESTWHYGVAIGRYTITFENGRVASFTAPSL